jgi:hypothetical protein
MANRSIFARTIRVAAQSALGVACGFALYPAIANAETADGPAAPAAVKVSMEQKICVRDTLTGTRIARKDCRTRGEWIKTTGVDPSAAK